MSSCASHAGRSALAGRPPAVASILRRSVASHACTPTVLSATPLAYRGVLVDGAVLPRDALAAQRVLSSSLTSWRMLGTKSAWLRLSLSRDAELFGAAERCGFIFHHARNDEAVLKQWLHDGEDKIPPFATHQVGCAGFVLNERSELLVVKEWQDPPAGENSTRNSSTIWKLPGGMLNAGETFADACCREVIEETGIHTEFASLLAFWHRHNLQPWGKSDIYVVCKLNALTEQISADPEEISACKWMPLEEWRAHDHPLISHISQRCFAPAGKDELSVLSRAEIVEGSVQWPGREPYPTYTAACVSYTIP